MIVGKPNPTVTINDVLGKFSEVDILSKYLGIRELPCLINSPLRKDLHPSFSLKVNAGGKVLYHDFSNGEYGGIFDLLCKFWNLPLQDTLYRIYNDFIRKSGAVLKGKNNSKSIARVRQKENSRIEVKIRPWKDYDYQYWMSYGVNPGLFKRVEVYPISHKIVIRRDSTGLQKRIVLQADKYAYVFVERKEGKASLKIYQPFNKGGYKWCSKMDKSVISLWTVMPRGGDRLVICSSLKDALCVMSQLGIPAIAPQGEGYCLSDTAINELRRRFKKVFISFDTDKAGMEDSKKLAMKTGFINVTPDFHGQKDFSDYYKSLVDKDDFKQLNTLFI